MTRLAVSTAKLYVGKLGLGAPHAEKKLYTQKDAETLFYNPPKMNSKPKARKNAKKVAAKRTRK